jgi:hypothetical protein
MKEEKKIPAMEREVKVGHLSEDRKARTPLSNRLSLSKTALNDIA